MLQLLAAVLMGGSGIPKYGRRDSNEKSIVKVLRGVGALVWRLNIKGLGDLLVLFRGQWFVLEIKTSVGKLTPAQIEMRKLVEDDIKLARTPEAALLAIGATVAFPLVVRPS